jgi:hypothetical protein
VINKILFLKSSFFGSVVFGMVIENLCYYVVAKSGKAYNSDLASTRANYRAFKRYCNTYDWTHSYPKTDHAAGCLSNRFTSPWCRFLLTASLDLYTYILLTFYPRTGSRGISDIPPRRASRFTYYVLISQISPVSRLNICFNFLLSLSYGAKLNFINSTLL